MTWIANPISLDAYGMDKNRFHMIQYDFESIDFEDIDMIFLCRSDAWLPPHLDYAFNGFLKFLCKTFDNVKGEPCIKSTRDMQALIDQQVELYNMFEKKYKPDRKV